MLHFSTFANTSLTARHWITAHKSVPTLPLSREQFSKADAIPFKNGEQILFMDRLSCLPLTKYRDTLGEAIADARQLGLSVVWEGNEELYP